MLAEMGLAKEAIGYAEAAQKEARAAGAASGGAGAGPHYGAGGAGGAGELNAPLVAALAAAVEERLRGHVQASGKGSSWGLSSKGAQGGSFWSLGGIGNLIDKGINSLFGDEIEGQQGADAFGAGPGAGGYDVGGSGPAQQPGTQQGYPPLQQGYPGAAPGGGGYGAQQPQQMQQQAQQQVQGSLRQNTWAPGQQPQPYVAPGGLGQRVRCLSSFSCFPSCPIRTLLFCLAASQSGIY